MTLYTKSLLTVCSILLLVGCAGTDTFHELARPGDTVAVAAGYRNHFQRDNITVTITDANGATTVYSPGELHDPLLPPSVTNTPVVRAAVNLYPDPLSSWIVSDRTGVQQTPNALTYVGQNLFQNTETDYDWWQTVVFLDLPVMMDSPAQPMATGPATILIETPPGPDQETHAATVNIVPGTGQAHSFDAITKKFGVGFSMEDQHMQALERVPYSTLSFSGTTVPHAIQVDLSHDSETVDQKAYVSNPTGHVKGVTWKDDGINTRIILMPNRETDIRNSDANFDGLNDGFVDFRIYLAGIGGWTVMDTTPLDATGNVQAYDINGNAVNGVTASIN